MLSVGQLWKVIFCHDRFYICHNSTFTLLLSQISHTLFNFQNEYWCGAVKNNYLSFLCLFSVCGWLDPEYKRFLEIYNGDEEKLASTPETLLEELEARSKELVGWWCTSFYGQALFRRSNVKSDFKASISFVSLKSEKNDSTARLPEE